MGSVRMDSRSRGLIERLKRRHVFRVTAIYAAGAWILIQIFSIVLPDLGVPRSSVRVLIVALLLGFPLLLVLGWMLVPPTQAGRGALSRWKRWHWRLGPPLSLAVAAFVTASGWYLWQLNGQHPLAPAAEAAAPEMPRAAANSIAVLPFTNLSNDRNQQYFSDGIAQELATALGQVPNLRVIAWQSSSTYHGDTPIEDVGRRLGVASILTGSIMREAGMVRVSVTLLNSRNGYQLWSAHFDRPLRDVFAVQDDISRTVAAALRVQFGGSLPLVRQATDNPEAHDAYLQGLAELGRRSPVSIQGAIRHFLHAVELDHRYAEAYVELGRAYTILPEFALMTVTAANAAALPALHTALEINPDLSTAHSVLGVVYLSEKRPDLAKSELLRALSLNPNDALARTYYAYLLPMRDAVVQFQQAVLLDPDSWSIQMNLGSAYAGLGQYDLALQAYATAERLAPENVDAYLEAALLQHLQGHDAAAIRALKTAKPKSPNDARVLEAFRLTYTALHDPRLQVRTVTLLDRISTEKTGSFSQYYAATAYALLGEQTKAVTAVARFCAAIPDSCNDIALDPHYLPLRANPAFQQLAAQYSLKH